MGVGVGDTGGGSQRNGPEATQALPARMVPQPCRAGRGAGCAEPSQGPPGAQLRPLHARV